MLPFTQSPCSHARLSAALLMAVMVLARGETRAELDDAAARMQYAFYTGDARALEEVLSLIEEFELDASLAAEKSYQMAYGYWKLAQLHADRTGEPQRPDAKSLAAQSAQACVQHSRAAMKQDNAIAEAYAINAICEGFSPGARAHGSSDCARSKSLRTALSLAPHNPRVQLIEALCTATAPNDPLLTDRWRAVVETFEAAPASASGTLDWGHVEALTLLGESYLRRGDPIAARDALERALVLAPDYTLARTLLESAATRPL